ncbi:hypothetical protein [Halomicrobium katesii]|uniref:hypothetical protein n=1 Tax=Halomicrobium katesii TaxID=437163 RepID=UPI0003777579|nr:hypothetical protein [Halomicrobium katesii]
MRFDGEIDGHECDAYHDKAAKRTPEENEYSEQARKFARYYVYLERGYDTVPPVDHPERIDAVRLALQELSDDEFEALFGDLHQQMQSYHDTTTDRVIPEPAAATEDILYRQRVYLGVNPLDTDLAQQAEGLAHAHGLDLSEDSLLETIVDELTGDQRDDWEAFGEDLADLADDEDVSLDDSVYIDGASSLYATYLDESGVQHDTEPDQDPHDREPDTLIELPPIDPHSLDQFRAYLDHHLKCQIRDCFIRMGVHPPEEFRVLGNGRLESVAAYKLLEMYPDYHDPDADDILTI